MGNRPFRPVALSIDGLFGVKVQNCFLAVAPVWIGTSFLYFAKHNVSNTILPYLLIPKVGQLNKFIEQQFVH